MVKEIAGYIVAPMWREFMDVALAKVPKEYFNEPPAIPDSVPPVLRGQVIYHSLLLLTDKNNPQGGAPLNPYSDPQLNYWETPILAWGAGITNLGATTTPTTELTDREQRDLDREERRRQREENN